MCGEGMAVKGGSGRGDLVVELLVGNRLQSALANYGLVAAARPSQAMRTRRFWLRATPVCGVALAHRGAAALRRVRARRSGRQRPLGRPSDSCRALQEAGVHLGLFAVLLMLNPAYACMHALSRPCASPRPRDAPDTRLETRLICLETRLRLVTPVV